MQVLAGHWCPNQRSGKDKGGRKGQERELMPVAVPISDLKAP